MKLEKVSIKQTSSKNCSSLNYGNNQSYNQNPNLLNQQSNDSTSFGNNMNRITKSPIRNLLLSATAILGIGAIVSGCSSKPELTKTEWVNQWITARNQEMNSHSTPMTIDQYGNPDFGYTPTADELLKMMEKDHPDLYEYYSNTEYREALEETDQQLQNMANTAIENYMHNTDKQIEEMRRANQRNQDKLQRDLEYIRQKEIADQNSLDADRLIDAANRINNGH